MPTRKAIRDLVVAALQADAALLALVSNDPNRIQAGRLLPATDEDLPLVLVYVTGDTADDELLLESPRTYRITSELVIEFVHATKVKAATTFEDEADEAAAALELVVNALEVTRFAPLDVRQARYSGTEIVAVVDGSLKTYASRVRWALEYGRELADAYPNDFDTNEVRYDVGDAAADDPDDSISIPQS